MCQALVDGYGILKGGHRLVTLANDEMVGKLNQCLCYLRQMDVGIRFGQAPANSEGLLGCSHGLVVAAETSQVVR